MMPRFTLSLENLNALPDIHVKTPTGQHFDKHFPLIQHKIIAFYHKLAQRQVIIPYHHSSRVHVCLRNRNANHQQQRTVNVHIRPRQMDKHRKGS